MNNQNIIDPKHSSGFLDPLWFNNIGEGSSFSELTSDKSFNVCIIGGGICGLSIAYELAVKGKSVAVFEDGNLASGETGRTTAHLTYALDTRYYTLEERFGNDSANIILESHKRAINQIENIISVEKIDCNFKRVDGFLFFTNQDEFTKELKFFKNNYNVVQEESIINFTRLTQGQVLKFPNQAKFHPLKYINGLATAIIKYGGSIFTNTHIKEIGSKLLISDKGFKINTDETVIATFVPVHTKVSYHDKQIPMRTYVITFQIPKKSHPDILAWDTYEPYHYVRLDDSLEEYDRLIIGGEDHKTGHNDPEKSFTELLNWSKRIYPQIIEVETKWSGQIIEPLDGIGLIGQNSNKDIYIATGHSGNGMTYGAISGMLISDLILNKKNPWQSIYNPLRRPPMNKFLKMNINVGKKFFNRRTKEEQTGFTHKLSTVCPHLKCIVNWNNEEKSFDCPCHGSRFSSRGEVVGSSYFDVLKQLRKISFHSKMKEITVVSSLVALDKSLNLRI